MARQFLLCVCACNDEIWDWRFVLVSFACSICLGMLVTQTGSQLMDSWVNLLTLLP